MPVNPTGADLKRYLAEDPGGPVVMLNLLKLVEGGRDGYAEYVAAFGGFLHKVGGRVLHIGDLGTDVVQRDDFDWDVLLVVEYPTRSAFTQMVADPDYQTFTHLRTGSVSEAVLQASSPWT
jgi:uncharacterized protein (DUF1330 family)